MFFSAFRNRYGTAFIVSAIVHVLLFVCLFSSIIFSNKLPYVVEKSDTTNIVHATAVSQQQVSAQVAKIQADRQAKEAAQAAKIQKIKQQVKAAAAQRLAEQQKMAALQKQQQAKEQAAKANLQKIAEKQAVETQRLADLQKQNLAAAQKLKQQKAQQQKQVQEQQEQEQAEQQLQDRLAKQKQKKAEKLAQTKKDAEDLLQQQMKDDDKQLNQAKNQYVNGIVDKYKALIIQAISQKWLVPPNANKDLKSVLAIHLAPGGTVIDVELVTSSGNVGLDRSAIAAVYKASPLPVPSDSNAFEQYRQFDLVVSPENVLQG